jgi:hypothetical protein
MLNRYDITDNRDKLGALEAARKFVEQARRQARKPGPHDTGCSQSVLTLSPFGNAAVMSIGSGRTD